mmetsp:Transcript_31180/g.47751  ORF Transcript_31180/g.47751 Transcript_31180/m.47751 type:complete len:457 (+) Transcript_31180:106-1476(+)|eukprot:CAMPEP_0195281180 /NCGR_PEP_ID=MMETSP0707-20130614/603_1 /TAXON_ID=33640 /ORGANISM="Asterionellopsis glacialis, Strain CCMP134" /LENGTH=456 /DNA_ID=CAMNT_0040340039 /DNA_START=92 /DNA_END=1462 /DNA_ORIENTATION=-
MTEEKASNNENDTAKNDNEASSRHQPWTLEEMNQILEKTNEILSKLDDELTIAREQETQQSHYQSWLKGKISMEENKSKITDTCRYFDMFGFVKMNEFVSLPKIQNLKDDMKSLTEEKWDPTNIMAFQTDEKSNTKQGSNDYFLESASRVHFFAEPSALMDTSDGSQQLKPYYQQNIDTKLAALNKAGHGMHTLEGSAFQQYATSSTLQTLVHELGFRDPVIPQSMYIFKQPHIGGAIHSHQDSTFLFTEPQQSCLGLWLALDDATLENGCLWVRPKSHNEHVRRQFKRNSDFFGADAIEQRSNVRITPTNDTSCAQSCTRKNQINTNEPGPPKMIMERLVTDDYYNDTAPWEGALPPEAEDDPLALLEAGFIPIECKAGDLLAFGGQLDHLSLPNYSPKPRHTFQLHLVEGPKAGITWSKHNWLQYPPNQEFISIAMDNDTESCCKEMVPNDGAE